MHQPGRCPCQAQRARRLILLFCCNSSFTASATLSFQLLHFAIHRHSFLPDTTPSLLPPPPISTLYCSCSGSWRRGQQAARKWWWLQSQRRGRRVAAVTEAWPTCRGGCGYRGFEKLEGPSWERDCRPANLQTDLPNRLWTMGLTWLEPELFKTVPDHTQLFSTRNRTKPTCCQTQPIYTQTKQTHETKHTRFRYNNSQI
jgi:hypothetical protein